jgi:thiol-disulfide isomerase/thioredoxin
VNPDDVVSLGPLVLALDRVVALGLFAVFLWAIDWIVRRHGAGRASLGWWALAAGLIAARLDYVAVHRASFALEPLEALRVWLGEWTWFTGVIAALAVLGGRLGRTRAMAEAAGVLGLLALVWGGFAENRAAPTPLRLPPDLVFQRLDGTPLRLGDLRGQPVILNLWATWCPPCRRETPMLSRAAAEPGAAPILLVNQGEERAAVQRVPRGKADDDGQRDLPPAGPAVITRVHRFDIRAAPPAQARRVDRFHLAGTPGALVPVFGSPATSAA